MVIVDTCEINSSHDGILGTYYYVVGNTILCLRISLIDLENASDNKDNYNQFMQSECDVRYQSKPAVWVTRETPSESQSLILTINSATTKSKVKTERRV
jgi:hypothetical protein